MPYLLPEQLLWPFPIPAHDLVFHLLEFPNEAKLGGGGLVAVIANCNTLSTASLYPSTIVHTLENLNDHPPTLSIGTIQIRMGVWSLVPLWRPSALTSGNVSSHFMLLSALCN